MKKHLLLLGMLLASALPSAWAQSRPPVRKPPVKPGPATRPTPGAKPATTTKPTPGAKPATTTKNAPKPPPVYTPIVTQRAAEEDVPPPMVVSKIKLKKPVLVYYQEPAPGKAVQQLVMSEENLALLKTLDLEHLMSRRDVYVDGLGNLAAPGSDATKFRLLGTSLVAEDNRRPAGDGRSTYSRLKVASPGMLYVVRESAEEYRHFVKGPQAKGSLLDFQFNGLPGVDSVRAVYTLRKTEASERGAGSGETIR